MLRQETGRDDRRRDERGRGGGGGRLRKSVPFVAAFLAGFLLGKRRGGDASAEETGGERGKLTDAVTRVRERMTPGGTEIAAAAGATDQPGSVGSVAGEAERGREREGDAASPAVTEVHGAHPARSEAAGIDEAVAALSAPTTRGMPMLGVGTAQEAEYDECFESVRQALRMGYRHVDTTEQREAYYNETAVGDAVGEAEVAREDLFVATKVSPDDLDFDHVFTSVEESLERLGMDSVDLLYVHWPTGEYEATDTLDAFAELREDGPIEEIGVSNFTADLLEEALDVSEEPIFANRVEMHPLLPQEDLREFCARDDVDVELVAYSPIARGDVDDVGELREVAEKHEATPAQVSLAWLREKGVTAIPEAASEAYLRENWLSLGVELDDEDVEKIDAIEERRRIVDPDEAPWNQ